MLFVSGHTCELCVCVSVHILLQVSECVVFSYELNNTWMCIWVCEPTVHACMFVCKCMWVSSMYVSTCLWVCANVIVWTIGSMSKCVSLPVYAWMFMWYTWVCCICINTCLWVCTCVIVCTLKGMSKCVSLSVHSCICVTVGVLYVSAHACECVCKCLHCWMCVWVCNIFLLVCV